MRGHAPRAARSPAAPARPPPRRRTRRLWRPASVCSSQPRWPCTSSCTATAELHVDAAGERAHERAHAGCADQPVLDRLPTRLARPRGSRGATAQQRRRARRRRRNLHEGLAASGDELRAVVEGEVAAAARRQAPAAGCATARTPSPWRRRGQAPARRRGRQCRRRSLRCRPCPRLLPFSGRGSDAVARRNR